MAFRLALVLSFAVGLVMSQRPVPFEKEGVTLTITPTIMTGILFGLFWVTLFLAGFCCLFQVQTPSAYEEKGLSMNKNY